jgi:DNA polymerase delta subunit 2
VLSEHLLDIAASIPVHILPGQNDPSGTILPQQAFPRAMFGAVSSLPTFACETNPTYLHLSSQQEAPRERFNMLIHSGQPLDDMFKYVPTPPVTRLALAEATVHWRHMAPTAPDTLWCHPYFTADPFIIGDAPNLYIIGNQPLFQTKQIKVDSDQGPGLCRIVLLPSFAQSGLLVLVHSTSLDVKTVNFSI